MRRRLQGALATLALFVASGAVLADAANSPYDPQVSPVPAAVQAQTLNAHCDGPHLKWADCDLQARSVCKGNFVTIKASEADFPAAGPWRRGGGRGHSRWGDDESGVQKPVQRTLQFRCTVPKTP